MGGGLPPTEEPNFKTGEAEHRPRIPRCLGQQHRRAPSSDRRSDIAGQSRDNALGHIVVVVFENRSLDNLLGRLCGLEHGRIFDGVRPQLPLNAYRRRLGVRSQDP